MALTSLTGQFITTSFRSLAPHVGAGAVLPGGWQSITTRPLLILVGPTGVGKSTTVKQLTQQGLGFTLLPDRRVLTDELIIAPQAVAQGRAEPVTCRLERLEFARRYRDQHPGGMGEILQQLAVLTPGVQSLLIFDGLRGRAEVSYAAQALPQAAFVMLDAPDWVRLLRMLHRQDPFDRVQAIPASSGVQAVSDLEALGIPQAMAYFSPSETAAMLSWVQTGLVTPHELRGKLKVIVEQAQTYQPAATRAALRQWVGDRSLIIDTARQAPDQVAQAIIALVRALWPSLA